MGLEERDVISPAIERMKQKNYRVSGPYPGDTIFSPDKLKSADVILAMYHDQGLAPFKFATFGEGVNVLQAFNLLPDPQTNGGLLISVNENAVEEVMNVLTQNGLIESSIIGKITEQQEKRILVEI